MEMTNDSKYEQKNHAKKKNRMMDQEIKTSCGYKNKIEKREKI